MHMNACVFESICKRTYLCLWFKSVCSLNIYVVTVYRPPSNSVESNDALLGFIAEFCIDKELIVHADFTHRELFSRSY